MQCFPGAEGGCGKGQEGEITKRHKEAWGGDGCPYLTAVVVSQG